MIPDSSMSPFGGGAPAGFGGGDMGGGMPPGFGPPPGPPPEETGGEEMAAPDLLQGILDLADMYRRNESSQQNLLLVEKLRTIAQQILANEEKEQDGLMQGKFTPQAIRRSAGAL